MDSFSLRANRFSRCLKISYGNTKKFSAQKGLKLCSDREV